MLVLFKRQARCPECRLNYEAQQQQQHQQQQQQVLPPPPPERPDRLDRQLAVGELRCAAHMSSLQAGVEASAGHSPDQNPGGGSLQGRAEQNSCGAWGQAYSLAGPCRRRWC